jgi:SulP family sulfate permease
VPSAIIVLLMIMLGCIAGLIQILLGFVGVGRLIKYIPYPVVSGYLSGVGLIIIGSQIPRFAGAAPDAHWWNVIFDPASWDWRAVAIGSATIAVALLAPKITQKVPSTILGVLAGVLTYFVLAIDAPELRVVTDNALIVGRSISRPRPTFSSVAGRWKEIGELRLGRSPHCSAAR